MNLNWKISTIFLLFVVILLSVYVSYGKRAVTNGTIADQYADSRFKVVSVIPNPFGNQSALYVVAERGVNDSGCGGAYGPRMCYFFLESTSYGVPPTQYIGSWGDHFAGIGNDIHFTDENTVMFNARGGDAGFAVSEIWKLDTKTGSTTMLSREENDTD